MLYYICKAKHFSIYSNLLSIEIIELSPRVNVLYRTVTPSSVILPTIGYINF